MKHSAKGGAGTAGHLALLGAATREFLESRNPDTLVLSILANVSAALGTGHTYLCLADTDTGVLSVTAGSGVFERLAGYPCPQVGGFSGRLRGPHGAIVRDCRLSSAGCNDIAALGVRTLAEVPLGLRGLSSGTLGAAFVEGGRAFDESQLDLLAQLGQLAALTLENAHLDGLAERELRERRRVEEELRDMIAWLQRSEDDLRRSRAETIARLAHAAEFRSLETAVHVERMSRYCASLAARVGLPDDRIELIQVASTLHDVGKIAIPDGILLKPGALTDHERRSMMRHAEIGNELLSGSSSEVLELAAVVALTHHERFDGRGYPRQLSGEEIPIEGRIAAVGDVFDALLSDRVYRPALCLDEAVEIMSAGRGSHFDPDVLDLFLGSLPDLAAQPAAVCAALEPALRPPASGAGKVSAPLSLLRPESVNDPAEVLDPERLRAACDEALRVLEEVGRGKEAIDLAVARLTNGWNGKLIASVYLLEHDRLWVISQRGYSEVVHDGFPVDQGVMARAVRKGETQFVADVTADEDFIAAARGLVSEVAVPFPATAPVGVFNVESVDLALPAETATLFDPLVAAFASRLETMREGLGLDIAGLARLCVHASSLRGTPAIAEFACRTLGRFLQLESSQVALQGADGSSRIASHWRRPDSQLDALDIAAVEQIARVRQEDTSVAAFGILPASDLDRCDEADGRAPWVVWLPLRVAGTEIGMLVGRSAVRELDREHIEAASLIAQHVAALIDIAQRLRREQRAAATDSLTGLLNRRGFEERFAEEIARAERHGDLVSLLLIDCDGLKRFNDLDGHNAGDEALRHLAACVRSNKRVSDIAARFGGDEFAIVLSGASAEDAAEVAERIRNDIAADPVAGAQRVTASFGLAVFPADGATTPALIAAADEALYRAKRAGGNQVLKVA